MNNTSKALWAYIQCSGVTDARDISDVTGIPIRTVYRCLREIKTTAMCGNSAANDNATGGTIAMSDGAPSRAHKLPEENNNNNPPPPLELTPPKPEPKRKKRPRTPEGPPEGLDEFLAAYPTTPNMTTYKGVERFYKGALKKTDAATLLEAVKERRGLKATEPKFIKGPSQWLRDECWKLPATAVNGKSLKTKIAQMSDEDAYRMLHSMRAS